MSDLNLGLMVGKALASDRAVRGTAPIDVVKSTNKCASRLAVGGRGWPWSSTIDGNQSRGCVSLPGSA